MRRAAHSKPAAAASAGLAALAHEGEPLEPHDLWTAWSFEPGVVIPLALAALLYLRGARASRGITPRQQACFWAGWTVLALALVSPLHPLGEVLFSAHMAQHEILMLVAAPLLVLSRPLVAFLWGMPFGWRREVGAWSKARPVQKGWSALTDPMTAWWIHAVALWGWHAPPLFQATHRVTSGSTARSTSASLCRRCCSGGRCSTRRAQKIRRGRVLHLHHGHPHRHPRRAADVRAAALVSGVRRHGAGVGPDAARRSTDRRSHHVGSRRARLHGCRAGHVRRLDAAQRAAQRGDARLRRACWRACSQSSCSQGQAQHGVVGDRRRREARLGGDLQIRLRIVPHDRGHRERARTGGPAADRDRRAHVRRRRPAEHARQHRPLDPESRRPWIEKTAMPVLGVTQQDATDIAAYLYSIK